MVMLHTKSSLSLTLQDGSGLWCLSQYMNEEQGSTPLGQGIREGITENAIFEQGHEAEIYTFVPLGWLHPTKRVDPDFSKDFT